MFIMCRSTSVSKYSCLMPTFVTCGVIIIFSASYEIKFGAELDQNTTIVKNGVVVNTTLTPNTLDCAQYIPFWVSWASGVITAGLGQPGSQQLVSYTDGQPVEVNGIGLSSNMSDNNNGAFWDLKQDQGIVIRCQP